MIHFEIVNFMLCEFFINNKEVNELHIPIKLQGSYWIEKNQHPTICHIQELYTIKTQAIQKANDGNMK